VDLRLYFHPVNFELLAENQKYGRHSMGHWIGKDTGSFALSKRGEIKVALIGVPEESGTSNKGCSKAPAAIREQLYRLSNLESLRGVVDLGDLKPGKTVRDTWFALRDVVEYLSDSGITTVVTGGGQDLSVGIARAFRGKSDFVLSVADARVDVKTGRQVTGSSNFISRILREHPHLYHLQMIGIQGHLVPPAILAWLREQTFDYLPLGRIRDDFQSPEPLLRNTSFLSFDISAVRQSDAMGQQKAEPTGFFGEEACRIARFAGLSPRLSVFGLFEVNPTLDSRGTTSALAARMIWYFLEAFAQRRSEDPSRDKEPFIKYFVELEKHGEPVLFYHHPPTNRWWIEISAEEGAGTIAPCSENDYKMAVKQEIPDIWWKFALKTDRLSK